MRLMSRRLPAALVLLLLAGVLAGCWDRGPSAEEQDLKAQNQKLQTDLSALQTQAADAAGKARAARLEADQWKVKYEEAAGTDAVKAIAAKLKEILTDERVMLRVDGHTDNTPIRQSKWQDNLHLSLMRARAVVDALIQEGIPGEEMCAAGFGEWHPIAPNDADGGRAGNRRVELSLISVSSPASTSAP